MIDLHIHILPELDDGAETWEDTMEMAELAVDAGTRVIAAVCHANLPGRQDSMEARRYLEQLKRFRENIQKEKLPLTVCSGMEIFASDGMLERLRRGELLTINRTRYLLTEFPPDVEAHVIYRILMELRNAGYIPVIAHPERYHCVQRVPAHVYEWYRMGGLIQINKGSVLGRFGEHVRRTADSLLRHRLVTIAASDAHSPYIRTPRMDELAETLDERYGSGCSRLLLQENPLRILRGAEPVWNSPAAYDYSESRRL